MNVTDSLRPHIDRYQRVALIIGVAGLGASLAGAFVNPGQFYHSYLVAFLYWLGVALGSTALVMLHNLTGGGWGAIIRRPLEASSRSLPLMTLLAVPLVFGIPHLYEWARPEAASHHVIEHKHLYLNVPFFMARMAFYFAVWLLLSFLLSRWSAEHDATGDEALIRKLRALSGPGILLYALTVTFASVDWVMSLEPEWFSTIYGMLFMVGQVLTTLAFVIALLMFLADKEPVAALVSRARLNDLGNLMLAFVMLWAYLSFSQLLIIWSGNLPEEITWYTHRLHGGWAVLAVVLLVFHFALPFLLLLSRHIKRKARTLGTVAVALLVLRVIDLFWVTQPPLRESGFVVSWMDPALLVGIGGIWVSFFLWQLKGRPLVALQDARLREAVKHG